MKTVLWVSVRPTDSAVTISMRRTAAMMPITRNGVAVRVWVRPA